MIPVALSVLFTFLLHSTVFVAVTWAVTHFTLGRQPSAANRLWRLALVAPLLSTAVALAAPEGWRLGRLEVGAPLSLRADAEAPAERPRSLTPGLSAPAWPEGARTASPESMVDMVEPAATVEAGARWPLVVFGVLGLLALGRVGLLGGRMLVFRRRLRDRQPLLEGRAHERLQRLCDRPAPRLSVCPQVLVPMALGRQEICLPQQALDGLADAELDAVLAHELGHLERRDNRWLTLASALEALLFFQPLAAVVRRRLQETAELACDERAVELTGSARALARSLAEVAAWNLGGDLEVPVSAMAHRGGLLLRRVETLLADAGRSRRRLRPAAVRLLVATLCALALAIPGVGLGLRGDQESGVNVALAAPGKVTADPPKATAAANRFAPPVAEPEQDYRPGRSGRAARTVSPGALPPFPMPPLPPASFMEPMAGLMSGVMGGIVPHALSAAGRLGPLAGRTASLEIRRDLLSQRRSRGTLTADETRQLAEVERDLSRAREELKVAEKKLEVEMDAAAKEFEKTHGKEFERQMERWGEEYGKSMEKWGETFGKDMEKWGERFGKDMEKWAETFDREWKVRNANPAASRPKTEAPATRPLQGD